MINGYYVTGLLRTCSRNRSLCFPCSSCSTRCTCAGDSDASPWCDSASEWERERGEGVQLEMYLSLNAPCVLRTLGDSTEETHSANWLNLCSQLNIPSTSPLTFLEVSQLECHCSLPPPTPAPVNELCTFRSHPEIKKTFISNKQMNWV